MTKMVWCHANYLSNRICIRFVHLILISYLRWLSNKLKSQSDKNYSHCY